MSLTGGDIDELKGVNPGVYRFRMLDEPNRTLALFCDRNSSREDPMLIAHSMDGVALDKLLEHVIAHERECHQPLGHQPKSAP